MCKTGIVKDPNKYDIIEMPNDIPRYIIDNDNAFYTFKITNYNGETEEITLTKVTNLYRKMEYEYILGKIKYTLNREKEKLIKLLRNSTIDKGERMKLELIEELLKGMGGN